MRPMTFLAATLTHAPLYVGLLGVLIALLGINTSRHRLRTSAFADFGNDETLRRASRAHGLAVEHGVPLAIFLIVLELQGAGKGTIDVLGCAILAGRLLHPTGTLLKVRPAGRTGVVLTYGLEVVMSIWIVVLAIRAR